MKPTVAFACEFCPSTDVIFATRQEAKDHEAKCLNAPAARGCRSCENLDTIEEKGVAPYPDLIFRSYRCAAVHMGPRPMCTGCREWKARTAERKR